MANGITEAQRFGRVFDAIDCRGREVDVTGFIPTAHRTWGVTRVVLRAVITQPPAIEQITERYGDTELVRIRLDDRGYAVSENPDGTPKGSGIDPLRGMNDLLIVDKLAQVIGFVHEQNQ